MNTSNGKQHISRHPNGLQVFRRKLLPASMMSLLGLFAYGNDAWAGGHVSVNTTPTGGSIVGGNGTILQNGALTTIQQNSQLLSINWQSFNVGANASVLFKQPSFTSVALNRILDQNASQIFGHINSNGQVFLINTHGIIFGRTSQLNVGGLMASTLDLTPTDFLSNHFNLDAHGGSAGIVNHGTIDAASGSVSLVGGQVVNDGLIIANYGHINLDGADRAVLDFDGDGLIDIQITGALQKRLNADEAAVTNKGKLQADGGTVVLQASAAKDLFTNLVNNTGVVSAGGISTHGGKVQLIASGGNAVTSGTIDVSGAQGGSVQVLSDQNVSVTGNINASGTNGGGSIRVGGGFHGGEGLTTANTAYVGPSATLNADATQTGNGGSVVVWGNQGNDFEGSITARGGALGGNGGQVETSAHNGLNADGDVNASAAHGTTGSWLLDPYNVTIGGSNSGYSTINGSGTVEYSANANSSNIKASTIGAALNNGTDVFVYTNNAGGSQNGDITVSRGITANGQGSLYLQASGSIFVNNNISGDNFGDALNVYLWANYSGTGGATAYSRGTCASSTGCVVQIGNGAGITTNGGNLDIETNGGVSLAAGSGGGSSISTGGGNVTIGTSSNPVNSLSVTGGSSIATFGGNIDVETGGQASVDSTSYIDTTNTVGALGNLAINAGAGINAAGALTISGTTTLNGGAGAISAYDSGNGNNNLVGTVSITNEGNNAVIVSNDSGVLNLGKVSVGTSTLSLSGVGIAQSSGTTISQASGTNPVTSEAVTLIGGSAAITLNNANDFVGGITASNSGASNGITLNNGSNAMTLAGVTAGGGLLATSTGGIDLAGTITTGTGQNYQGAVTLTADSSLASNTGGAIVFNSTVDGAQNLSITNGGTTTFNGTVGSTVALQSLNVLGGGKTVLDANVTTAGTQSYGTLALGNSVILASTSAGVTFNGTVDNATSTTQEALTINAAGPVAFDGAV
ncbi:beta strand repeat-containing protein, partial [Dyella mobilis]